MTEILSNLVKTMQIFDKDPFLQYELTLNESGQNNK